MAWGKGSAWFGFICNFFPFFSTVQDVQAGLFILSSHPFSLASFVLFIFLFFQVLLPFCSKVPNKLPAVAAVSYPLVLTDVTFDSMLAVGCVTRAFSEQCTQEGDVQ